MQQTAIDTWYDGESNGGLPLTHLSRSEEYDRLAVAPPSSQRATEAA